MNREQLFMHIKQTYGAAPEYLWARTPNSAVFRHGHNRKWFGAVLEVTEDKLGLDGTRLVDVLDLKCDPLLVGSLRSKPGILPAYHMNKEHWITILLEGPLPSQELYDLLALSYQLTK